MTARKSIDELLDGRERRRMKYEDRFLDKLDRQMGKAEALIGKLMREGRTIFYINVQSKTGRLTGAVKEFATSGAASDYLIRNRYV